jgi:hypothetical protein
MSSLEEGTMRKTLAIALALGATALAALAETPVKTQKEAYPATTLKSVALDVPVAEVRIEGTTGTDVLAEMTVTCSKDTDACRQRAEQVVLASTVKGADLLLEVKGYSKRSSSGVQVELALKVPSVLALRLDLGVGDVEIEGVEGALNLDVGVGDLEVQGKLAAVASVELETGVGDAKLELPSGGPEASGFVGKELSWNEGKGPSRWHLEVGVGELEVRLK